MNPKQYVENVLITESRDFSKLSERICQERNIRLLHAGLGLCTEATELFEMLEKPELDLVNLKEEISDQTWYIGIIIDELKFNVEILVQPSMLDSASQKTKRELIEIFLGRNVKHVGLLQDLLKKSIFYGKPLSAEKIEEQVIEICKQIATLCEIGGVTIESCFQSNIDKLRARYGDKFSEAAAVNRNLAKEREILEKK